MLSITAGLIRLPGDNCTKLIASSQRYPRPIKTATKVKESPLLLPETFELAQKRM